MTTPREAVAETTLDPAIGHDPMTRVEFEFGVLLDVDDFETEQYERVLRRRIHQALLHGYGTAIGLDVQVIPDDVGRATRIAVQPGWGIDWRGRDLYVSDVQCLDIDRLHLHELWHDLPEVDGARRAWVVLRHLSVLDTRVPSFNAPVCAPSSEGLAYSRVSDRVRIDLWPELPPRSPLPVALAASPQALPRDAWIDAVTSAATSLDPLRAIFLGPSEAPLLLAQVDLLRDGDRTEVVRIDNGVRPVLPSVQGLAEQLLDVSLREAGSDERFCVVRVNTEADGDDLVFRFATNGVIRADTAEAATSAAMLAPTPGAGWQPLDTAGSTSLEDADATLVVRIDAAAFDDGTVVQVCVSGDSDTPLVDTDVRVLAGRLDTPVPPNASGSTVRHRASWPL